MEPWIQTILTILGSVLASSGFWAFMQKRSENKDSDNDLLLGLAHERIMSLIATYMSRRDENGNPWITQNEYEDLHKYLYTPYKNRGGNGSAEKAMKDLQKIPMRYTNYVEE